MVVPSVFRVVLIFLSWLTVLFILLYDVTFHLLHFLSQVVHTACAMCFGVEESLFCFFLGFLLSIADEVVSLAEGFRLKSISSQCKECVAFFIPCILTAVLLVLCRNRKPKRECHSLYSLSSFRLWWLHCTCWFWQERKPFFLHNLGYLTPLCNPVKYLVWLGDV